VPDAVQSARVPRVPGSREALKQAFPVTRAPGVCVPATPEWRSA
jgi:hypothetical protein